MNAETLPRPALARRAQVLRALGDPIRLGVVDLLQVQDLSPDALCTALEVPGNLLAHHLKVLEGAGIVVRSHSQNDKRRTYVQLAPGAIDDVLPRPFTLFTPRIVFVCTHNSARSVLADALWRQTSSVPSTSAGTQPAKVINPRARRAAKRHSLTITQHAPQRIDNVLRDDDLIVSVCDSVNEEIGPRSNLQLHWSVPDPTRAGTDVSFDAAVDELRERVDHLAPLIQLSHHHP